MRLSELHRKAVTGIEPATFGTVTRRSNHCEVFLNYGTRYFSNFLYIRLFFKTAII